jgi:hypothetical protein
VAELADAIDVAAVAAALAMPGRPARPDEIRAIDLVARRIATSRRLPARLDAGGKASDARLDLAHWPTVIRALVAHAAGGAALGRALKRLNAAFVALDLAREAGLGHEVAAVAQDARARLDALVRA